MKRTYLPAKKFFLYFCFIISALHINLNSHGFGTHIFVHMADGSLEEIGMLCHRVLDKKLSVLTYDTSTATRTSARIKRCGKSKTNRYVSFCFDGPLERAATSAIVCTPTQAFYSPNFHAWIPAYQLQVGDELLCKQGIKKINAVEYVKQSLEVYTLQIQNTHTFFVGYHGALTHNMGIPAAFGLGLSIPFGSVAGSAAAGSFFGPPALIVGAMLGSAIGAFVSIVQSDSIPSYKVNLSNTHYIDDFVHQQSEGNGGKNTTPQHSGNFISPMPDGPKKDDNKDKKRKKLSDNADDLKHMFRKKQNHFGEKTFAITAMIEELANDVTNYLGSDKRGHDWYAKILENGQQLWAKVEGNIIRNAGINEIPRLYNAITGLCSPPKA